MPIFCTRHHAVGPVWPPVQTTACAGHRGPIPPVCRPSPPSPRRQGPPWPSLYRRGARPKPIKPPRAGARTHGDSRIAHKGRQGPQPDAKGRGPQEAGHQLKAAQQEQLSEEVRPQPRPLPWPEQARPAQKAQVAPLPPWGAASRPCPRTPRPRRTLPCTTCQSPHSRPGASPQRPSRRCRPGPLPCSSCRTCRRRTS